MNEQIVAVQRIVDSLDSHILPTWAIVALIIGIPVLTSVLTGIVAYYLFMERRKAEAKWVLKHDACLEALQVVNVAWSHMEWEQDGKVKTAPEPMPQPSATSQARTVMNKLALVCDNPLLVSTYLDCLGMHAPGETAKKLNGALINDFRKLIREELGFGANSDLLLDPSRAYIAVLGVDVPGGNP